MLHKAIVTPQPRTNPPSLPIPPSYTPHSLPLPLLSLLPFLHPPLPTSSPPSLHPPLLPPLPIPPNIQIPYVTFFLGRPL